MTKPRKVTIKVGDRVQWQQRRPQRHYLFTLSGIVVHIEDNWAEVLCGGHLESVSLHKLRLVETAAAEKTAVSI